MGDLTGLGKAVDGIAKLAHSQVAVQAYEDLLSDAMKQGGQALADGVKAFRLFTAPIQLLALAQDRLAAYCEQVRNRVPEERQVEPPPSIVTPVLLSLRYMEDDNLLTELYLNLLARAIDKERQNEAHPAFARIIEQLSPDEAMVMYVLREHKVEVEKTLQEFNFPLEKIAYPDHFVMYLKHLESLGLVRDPLGVLTVLKKGATGHKQIPLEVTAFGRLFIKACIPADIADSASPWNR